MPRAAWVAAAAVAATAWSVANQGEYILVPSSIWHRPQHDHDDVHSPPHPPSPGFHDGLGFFHGQSGLTNKSSSGLLGRGGRGGHEGAFRGGGGMGQGQPTSLLAARAPLVMDGQGTALPAVMECPIAEPVTVMAWILAYSPYPHSQAIANANASLASLLPPPPPESALLSFGRPRPYRLHTNGSSSSAAITPAPGLHLSVGADPKFKGHMFFAGAADDRGRLTGFFSRQVLIGESKQAGPRMYFKRL